MMQARSAADGPPIDMRLRYWRGQALLSDDLNADRAQDSSLAAWHMRGLHGTWGIAAGLGVKLAADGSAVLICPGCAVDCRGRAMVLHDPVEIDVPRTLPPEGLHLVASYGSSCERSIALRWKSNGAIHFGDDVPLARVHSPPMLLAPTLDITVRQNARRARRQYLGWGVASGLAFSSSGDIHSAEISTSSAQFQIVPHYFAFVRTDQPVFAFQRIANLEQRRFTLELIGIPLLTPPPASADVFWVGIEPDAFAPLPDLRNVRRMNGGPVLNWRSRWLSVMPDLNYLFP